MHKKARQGFGVKIASFQFLPRKFPYENLQSFYHNKITRPPWRYGKTFSSSRHGRDWRGAERCRKAMEAKAGTPESPQKNGKMFFYQAFVKKQKRRKKEIKIFTKNCMPNKD
ncbi:MAG: hypothetical protein II558_09890 [Treponema sp.]|nr:hypothetical protein [Treponema sp.]